MKSVEMRFPQDIEKSFVVFEEIGQYFPVPWHYHPEYEIVLVIKSTGRRMVGDNIGYFNPGDLVCMGPLLPHVWVNDPVFINGRAGYLAEAVGIHFNDNFLGEKFLEIPEMQSFKKFLSLFSRGIVIQGKAKKEIGALMKKMPEMNGLQRLASLLSIFDILSQTTEYELLVSPGFVQNIDFKVSDRSSKITEYIMRNFDQDITLKEVASVANMALTTFCNFFKMHYRVTFVEYLTRIRIGHACRLLSEKDKNIIQIAYECGFNNLANFNRQFKKYKGMTPTLYKKTLVVPDCINKNKGHIANMK